jgi:cell volume regulation protein A
VLVVHVIAEPEWISAGNVVLLFIREMGGGALLGVGGGWVLVQALRRLPLEPSLVGVLALTGALALFGAAQLLGMSGFLAVYLAGVITGTADHRGGESVERFSGGMAWLAQIVLFVMLGMLVTPHDLPPYVPEGIAGAAVLMFIARPIAVFACLLPFRFSLREIAFASWVGLRGAVPIYLSLLPALADPHRDTAFFAGIFVLVVASLVVQGWAIAPAARLFGFR